MDEGKREHKQIKINLFKLKKNVGCTGMKLQSN